MKNSLKLIFILGILAYLFYPSGWDDFIGYTVGVFFVIALIIGIINGTLTESVKAFLNWLRE